MRLAELDPRITYAQQLHDAGDGPVVLVNVFTMEPRDVAVFEEIWAQDAAYMRRQPGYLSAQLHRGAAGSTTYLNVASWESGAALAAAFGSAEFQQALARYPDSVVATPHLFTRLAVPGICST